MQNLYKIMVILSYVCMYIKIFVEDKTTADIWKLDFTIDKPNNRYSSSMEFALVKKKKWPLYWQEKKLIKSVL